MVNLQIFLNVENLFQCNRTALTTVVFETKNQQIIYLAKLEKVNKMLKVNVLPYYHIIYDSP